MRSYRRSAGTGESPEHPFDTEGGGVSPRLRERRAGGIPGMKPRVSNHTETVRRLTPEKDISMKAIRSSCLFFIPALLLIFSAASSAERTAIDLSGREWGLYRDFDAGWIDDELHLPPVDVTRLTVPPPSCGWNSLRANIEKKVTLPATVEEHFWGDNGNTGGVAGDYRGVSWWVTSVTLGPEIRGRLLYLDFESVHLRAEVFVNRRLVGYDVIGHTPFSVDITGAVSPGENEIAVRITDPVGNFNWNDRRIMHWGKHDIPACHGFGGITGRVFLRIVDPVHIEDVYIMNKPVIREADVVVTLRNTTGVPVSGRLSLKVHAWGDPDAVIWEKTLDRKIAGKEERVAVTVAAPDAEVWSPETPRLYVAEASFRTDDGSMSDTVSKRFGFRWFDIGEKNGDRRFYLNGKRIVLRGVMSWGFWPVNGVYPTRETAERDIATAKKLGMTYMNFHRAVGQPLVMDVADEKGFLIYEEPGGYSCEGADPDQTLWREWRRIKLLRMVKRDRSHPSLIIYNLQNRTPNPPSGEDARNMRAAHELDPTRILTFISGFWKKPPKESPDKLFLKPYDRTEYYTGWFDMHNHTPEYGYSDDFYNRPEDYLRYTGIRDEIVFWGEDGGLYSPPRLQLIKEYHEENGPGSGWLVRRFLDWYEVFDEFLDENGFREFFPDVDSFTRTMGNTTLYYHGRIMENIRAGNLDDCYTINGWAAPHLVNQSEVADLYRNPSGDPEVLAYYCRPLYLAVKARDKVVPAGASITLDVFIINENDVHGEHLLTVSLENPEGETVFSETHEVDILGGEEYGQLLVEVLEIRLGGTPGYYSAAAVLTGGGSVIAEGREEVFSVDIDGGGVSPKGAVVDTSGAVNSFLADVCGFTLPEFSGTGPRPDYIVVGRGKPGGSGLTASITECVADGAVCVVVSEADRFAEFLASGTAEALDYRGVSRFRKGNFVAGNHEILDGLPRNQAFNWEYQIFYNRRHRSDSALILHGVKTIIAAVAGSRREVGTALTVVPFGRGKIVLSTLDILPWLNDDAPQAVTAKRLFLNYLKYASETSFPHRSSPPDTR